MNYCLEAQAKFNLSIKHNPEFHIAQRYAADICDKMATVKSMRGAPTAEILELWHAALGHVDKALSILANFQEVLSIGRDICRRCSQIPGEDRSLWLVRAISYGERARAIHATMHNCILLGGVYVDQALLLSSPEQEEAQLALLRDAQQSYTQGLMLCVANEGMQVPESAKPLLESDPTKLTQIWEFLAFEDEAMQTQTLDIMQRLTVQGVYHISHHISSLLIYFLYLLHVFI